jgi:hypothetical protein
MEFVALSETNTSFAVNIKILPVEATGINPFEYLTLIYIVTKEFF